MNTGSFGAAIGGGSSIVQAMQRRGIDASALDQSSMAGAMGASNQMSGPQMGGAMPMPAPSMGAPAGAPPAGPAPMGAAPNSSESQMIVRALQKRLQDLGEVEKGAAGIGAPAAPSMAPPPMGGMTG